MHKRLFVLFARGQVFPDVHSCHLAGPVTLVLVLQVDYVAARSDLSDWSGAETAV